MNSEELKKLQSPLKAKYRDDPDDAVITLHAEGKIGEGISCKIETGRKLVGLHPAAGGDGMNNRNQNSEIKRNTVALKTKTKHKF